MKSFKIRRKKVAVILILIFIVISCVLFKIIMLDKKNFQEDLIFFKIFGIGNSQEQCNGKSEYKIEVIKGKNSYKEIGLLQMIDINKLINKKVEPGTKGSFYVFLTSDSDVNYNMEIIYKNNKPENFKIEINEKEGKIKRNEVKKIEIKWEWKYEINQRDDVQDTEDGKNIEKFNFEICTIGK